MTIRTATGLIAWCMRLRGFRGLGSFWCIIYVMPGHEHDQRLLRRERKHLEQIESDGRPLLAIKYPYQVEARAAAESKTP